MLVHSTQCEIDHAELVREVVSIIPRPCGKTLVHFMVRCKPTKLTSHRKSIYQLLFTVEAFETVPESCKGDKAIQKNHKQLELPSRVFVCAMPSLPRQRGQEGLSVLLRGDGM